EDGQKTHVTFTVGKADKQKAIHVLEENREKIGYSQLKTDGDVSKISIIGIGMRSHAGVASKMFRTLAEKGINVQVITTSEIKISILVASEYTELAVRSLHSAFELDKED